MSWCSRMVQNATPILHIFNRTLQVNSLAPGTWGCNLKLVIFSKLYQGQISWVFLVTLSSGEYHKTSLMSSQHWFRLWLGAVRQQAITWTNVDQVLWCHMPSLGHNELRFFYYVIHWTKQHHILTTCVWIWITLLFHLNIMFFTHMLDKTHNFPEAIAVPSGDQVVNYSSIGGILPCLIAGPKIPHKSRHQFVVQQV